MLYVAKPLLISGSRFSDPNEWRQLNLGGTTGSGQIHLVFDFKSNPTVALKHTSIKKHHIRQEHINLREITCKCMLVFCKIKIKCKARKNPCKRHPAIASVVTTFYRGNVEMDSRNGLTWEILMGYEKKLIERTQWYPDLSEGV